MPLDTGGSAVVRRIVRASPLLALTGIGLFVGMTFALAGVTPPDAGIYYGASDFDRLYGHVWLQDGDYVYPPAFAMALWPLRLLGPAGFLIAWTGLLFLALAIAGRWVAVAFVVAGLVLMPVVGGSTPATLPLQYLLIGNAQALIPAAIVLGFRWPGLWSVVLLTKMLPGIGILWFAVRREWRALGWAVGVTALVVLVSILIAPSAWADYVGFLWANRATPSTHELAPVPMWVCLPVAITLIVWGARQDRRWTLPFACGIASLALYQWSYVIVWIAAAAFIAPPDIQGQLARLSASGTWLVRSRARARGLASMAAAGGSLILRLLH